MKKILAVIIVLVVVAGGVYYYTTLKSRTFLDEASPLLDNSQEDKDAMMEDEMSNKMIDDSDLEGMDDETKAELMKQTNEMADVVKEMNDEMPAQPTLVAEGTFKARLHSVAGNALLIDQGDTKTLRFEDFETDNGPKLHIYLAADLEADDYIDLGEIKATKGNVNYTVDGSIDTDKYNKVLIWCEPFGVLFSYAELN